LYLEHPLSVWNFLTELRSINAGIKSNTCRSIGFFATPV